jgi:ribosome-binding factor A
MNFRPLRIGKLIREELGILISREIDLVGTLVTVTEVDVSKKMDIAKVEVSVIPSAKSAETLKLLKENRGHLQHRLNHKLNIKPMPHILFEIDHGPENAAKVEKLLIEDDNNLTAA